MGSLKDAMQALTEDIVASEHARVSRVEELARETKDMLAEGESARREQFESLRASIEARRREREDEVSGLLGRFREEQKQMGDTLKTELLDSKKVREKEVSALLKEFEDEREEMGNALRRALSQGKADREKEVSALLRQFQDEHKQMAREVSALLSESREMLDRFRDDHRGMADAWANMVATLAQRKIGVSARKEERATEELGRAVEEKTEKALRTRIMAVVSENPEGMKLSRIGEVIGIAWQGLIPAVGALVEEGKIKKTENLYYPASE